MHRSFSIRMDGDPDGLKLRHFPTQILFPTRRAAAVRCETIDRALHRSSAPCQPCLSVFWLCARNASLHPRSEQLSTRRFVASCEDGWLVVSQFSDGEVVVYPPSVILAVLGAAS